MIKIGEDSGHPFDPPERIPKICQRAESNYPI